MLSNSHEPLEGNGLRLRVASMHPRAFARRQTPTVVLAVPFVQDSRYFIEPVSPEAMSPSGNASAHALHGMPRRRLDIVSLAL